MPDTFEDVATLEFVEKLVNGKYPVKVPKFLDHHQWWGNWERERFNSMEELLKPGMVFYDVGAFDGWQDVILSRFVGGGQMPLALRSRRSVAVTSVPMLARDEISSLPPSCRMRSLMP